MKIKLCYAGIILFSLFSCLTLHAQTEDTCLTNMKTANSYYEKGDYENAVKMIVSVLAHCPLRKDDKINSYKLLILSYLGMNNVAAAKKSVQSIMKINPNYFPDKYKDDPKLSALFDKFQPVPGFTAGISGGLNFPFVHVSNTYSIVHGDDITGLASYTTKVGYQIGVHAEYRCFKDLWAEAGFQYRQTGYGHVLDSVEGLTVNYVETLTYFEFPVSAKYYFLSSRLRPYIKAGVDFEVLNSALATTTRGTQGSALYATDLVDRSPYRNDFIVGYAGYAGLSYRIRSFLIFAEIAYSYFPTNVNKDGTRFSDPINTFKYYYIDDDFNLNLFQVNVGSSFIISYKNREVK
jgi:hypothetical protein